MSDPYRNDHSLDPKRNPNLDTTYRDPAARRGGGNWIGLAIAAFLVILGFMYFMPNRADVASNTTGTNTTRSLDKPMSGNPAGTNTPNTTGSAPAR